MQLAIEHAAEAMDRREEVETRERATNTDRDVDGGGDGALVAGSLRREAAAAARVEGLQAALESSKVHLSN